MIPAGGGGAALAVDTHAADSDRRAGGSAGSGDTARQGRAVGLLASVGLSGLAALAALQLGAAGLVALLFPAAAVGLALVLLHRRDGAYLEFVVWLWLLGPEVRRIVDLQVGWTPVSPVMAAAPAASLLCLVPALFGRRRVHGEAGLAFVVSLTAIGYALLVGALTAGPAPAAGALLVWLPPVALGLYVATSGPDRAELVRVLRRTAVWGTLALGLYGLVQFFALPAWDRHWMQNAPINSIGNPEPLEVRVFSLLNSPGPFAAVLGALLIVLTGVPARNRWVAAVAGLVSFGLSLVRTAWLGVIVAVGALVGGGRGRNLRAALLAVAIPVVLVAGVGGPVRDVVTDRFTDTVEEGSGDESFGERVELYREVTPQALTDPIGGGMGSTGDSTKLANAQGRAAENSIVDSGLVEILLTFGALVGLAVIVTLVGAVTRAWRRAKGGDDLSRAVGAALLGLLVQLVLANPLTSASGMLFWILLGFLARDEGARERGEAHAETHGGAEEYALSRR